MSHSRVYYNSKLELVTDITRPGALCDSVEKHQGGIWESMKIRGKEKQVMVLPIDFLGKRFYVAGIISDTEYSLKTRKIDSQFIILIAVLLLLILIGMPILKIIFIGKNERLRSSDASASLISSIFGTGLLILMILVMIKHKLIDHPHTDERLEQLSDTLYNNVFSNIDSIKNLFESVSYNDKLISNLDSAIAGNQSNIKNNLPCPYLLSQYNNQLPYISLLKDLSYWKYYMEKQKSKPLAQFALNHFMVGSKKFQLYNDTLLGNMFPINEIILVDKSGIIYKAVTSTQFSELVPVNLSQRNYFINAKDTSTSWPTKDHLRFYIESIKSYNTGDGETAISFHNPNCEKVPVTAITSALPALYQQVLPKDVEFVIINSTGKVLYHSIKSKNLHENFLDECDFDERLQNAMKFRTEGMFHVDYNEKNWMLRIIPIKDTPLFHITLIDLDQANNMNSRIFLYTFYFLLIVLIVIGIGMLLLRWAVPKASRTKRRWFLEWVFFKPEKFYAYLNLSFILLILIIVQFVGFGANNKPIAILLYHIIFITYSSFVSLIIINRKKLTFNNLFTKEFLPENLILLIVLVLVIIFFSVFSVGISPVLSVGVLVLLAFSLPSVLKGNDLEKLFEDVSTENKKRTYLLFLFLWLTSLAVFPVFQSYRSIKHQEEQIEKQQQLFTVAQKNLSLYNTYYKYRNVGWFKQYPGKWTGSYGSGFPGSKK